MSHTPAPWLLRPPSLTSAYIDTPKGGMSIQCSGIPDRSEWESNARLIAAAPELLAALQGLMGAEWRPKTGPLQYDSLREDAWAAADAAIAKAESR